MQITLPRRPTGFNLFLNKNTDRRIIVTCFKFPTTFIIKGPPSFTALKFATFRAKARNPWNTNRRRLDTGALYD